MSQPTDILAAENQITNYIRLAGSSATTSLLRFAPPAAPGGTNDLGMMPGGFLKGVVSRNGMQWQHITALTSTVILLLDMTSPIELLMMRDLTVEMFAKTSDDQNLQLTLACAVRVLERNKHIKLTGVTA